MIEDWDCGCEFELGIWDWNWALVQDWGMELRFEIRIGDWNQGLGLRLTFRV